MTLWSPLKNTHSFLRTLIHTLIVQCYRLNHGCWAWLKTQPGGPAFDKIKETVDQGALMKNHDNGYRQPNPAAQDQKLFIARPHYSDVIMGSIASQNHQPQDCLLNSLFRRRLKNTSKLRVTGLCAGNSPVTVEFPAQMASNAENASIWWRHHQSNTN